ncbi:MAG: preprotein translocase subunit SecY [Firmicutes bacterium]|nr:preprotein translocase subunit SecY [Bacillota bacterium]
MFTTLIDSFKNKDVRKKILITLGLLFLFRLGAWLPIPGIDPSIYYVGAENTMLMLLGSITGGALSNGAFMAIGVMPYINASIIMQLLTVAIPKFDEWRKQGDEGKEKLNKATRYLTLLLAIAQSVGIVVTWSNQGALAGGEILPVWLVGIIVSLCLIAGAMLTMWIGERITELGVGNGISLLIFVGIIATAGIALISNIAGIASFATAGSQDNTPIFHLIGFLGLVILIFTFIVFIDASERRVQIQYAKQIKGRKQYGGQSTHIPIKLNASGVLPIIFASAIVSFPSLIMGMIPALQETNFMINVWQPHFGVGRPVYSVVVGLLIFFFAFFYAQIQFNPEEVARTIQQNGGFIPGIRPGKPTAEHLKRISRRLTFFGALFLAFIAIVPAIIFDLVFEDPGLIGAFTATGLLIVVSVALDFDKQLQSQLMMKQYKGFLK